MKRCPFCAEEIQDAAIVCRFCNRDLPKPPQEKPQSAMPASGVWVVKRPPSGHMGCPACAKTIEASAQSCPHCGVQLQDAPLSTAPGSSSSSNVTKSALIAMSVIVVLIVITGLLAGLTDRSATTRQGGSSQTRGQAPLRPMTPAEIAKMREQEQEEVARLEKAAELARAEREREQKAAAKLALLSTRGYESYGHHIVEGQVRNISSEPLRNVSVLSTWLDGEGGFITTDEALIDYNPILPGQTSPFKTISTTNPAMKRYQVEFKHLMGGSIAADDQRKR